MRKFRNALHCTLASVWLVAWGHVAIDLAQVPDNGDRLAAVRMFEEGVERYAALRARLEATLPAVDRQRDDWSRMLTRRYLASAIRSARAHAREGDLFTPSVAVLIRQVIRQAACDQAIGQLADEEFHASEYGLDVVVNEPVPSWSMDAVPGALVKQLPALPQGIEYRMVGCGLILWDGHAELVIDVLPDAFLPH